MAKADPIEALDLMWHFMDLADSVFERCDDSNGTIIGIFHSACDDLAEIATAAKVDPKRLADQVFEALFGNGYGQYDDLITLLTPALGPDGLEHLKHRMLALSKQPVQQPPENVGG